MLVASSVQAEAIFIYMKTGYVLNKKSLLIFLTVILVF